MQRVSISSISKKRNALSALLSLEDGTHCWPDADERKQMFHNNQIYKNEKMNNNNDKCEKFEIGDLNKLSMLERHQILAKKCFT